MLKNKKQLMGIVLMLVFFALCLFILWQHHQEAKQVRTFSALFDLVEEKKRLGEIDMGCDGIICPKPELPDDADVSSTFQLSLLNPSMMIASAGSFSGLGIPSSSTQNTSFLVTQSTTESKQILPQYAAMHAQNPDFLGWIRIEGTKVNYPVMFSPQDPDRYLYKDFYGDYAKYGVPFIDGVTDVEHSRNLLIHGHNARSGILFGDLDKFLKKSFWDKHRYIHFDTLYEERKYEIVAVCRTHIPKADDDAFRYYEYANVWDDDEAGEYIQHVIERLAYPTGISLHSGDKFLTLSTCSNHKKDGRLIIIAKEKQ